MHQIEDTDEQMNVSYNNEEIEQRLTQEVEEIKESYDFKLEYDKEEEFYYCEGKIEKKGEIYHLKIVYPQLFPYLRPKIFLIEEGEILRNFETSHQLRDGSICIFTYDDGPNGWKWHYTLKNVLDKFVTFLDNRKKPEFETKHSSYYSRYYGKKIIDQIIIVPEEFKQFMLKYKKGAFKAERFMNKHMGGVFSLVKEIRNGRRKREEISNYWKNIPTNIIEEFSGHWFYIRNPVPSFGYIKTNNSLTKMLKNNVKLDLTQQNGRFPIIICYKLDRIGKYSLIGYHFDANDRGYLTKLPHYFDVDFIDLKQNIFKRTKQVIGKGLNILENKTVIGIGMGSIGSEIIVELVKSGVGKFILYDHDILEFSNLTNHACNSTYLGMNKAISVRDLLIKRNPLVNARAHVSSPLHENKIADFIRYLKEEDAIVIVATAEHEMEGAINRLIVEHNRPTIFASALENAHYGRIFRVLPKKTPCYECISTWNKEKPEEYPSIINGKEKEEKKEKGVKKDLGEFNAYRHPGFPGVSMDVKYISTLAARLALQTLLRDAEASNLYPDTKEHHFMWSNRKGWIFEKPLDIKSINYPINENCPVCGKER